MTTERQYWNEEMETMTEEQLLKLRMEKLKKQLKYCYDNSVFYNNKFKEIGAYPEDIKTWEDFRNLPVFMNKETERSLQEESLKKYGLGFGEILCTKPENLIRINASSGTTGLPTFMLLTEKDQEDFSEQKCRGLWQAGVRPHDRVLFTWGLSMFIAGIPVIDVFRKLGAAIIPVGAEGGVKRTLQFAELTKPTVLIAIPSFLEYLINKAPEVIGKEVSELGIKHIIATGEPGAGLPKVRERIEGAFGAKLFDCFSPFLNGFYISCDSSEYQGMHEMAPDYAIYCDDLIDPNTKKPIEVKNGAIGEACVTSLGREANPFIKYAWGDLIQVFTEPCSCGRTSKRIKIVGRTDDMLIVKGVNVFPASVKNLVSTFVPRVTGEMRIVLHEQPPRVNPPLHLKVEHSPNLTENEINDLKLEIEEKCHDTLRFRPRIEILPPNSITREVGATGKIKLIEKAY